MLFEALAADATQTTDTGSMLGSLLGGILIYLAIAYSTSMIAKKTGYGDQAWMAWVPVASLFLQLKIIQKPAWWVVLFLIPGVNFFAWIAVCIGLAKSRHKGIVTGLLASFIPAIGFPVMASGDA